MFELDYIAYHFVEVYRVVDEAAMCGSEHPRVTLHVLYVHQGLLSCHRRLTLGVTVFLYKQRRIGTCDVRAQCLIKDLLESTHLVTSALYARTWVTNCF